MKQHGGFLEGILNKVIHKDHSQRYLLCPHLWNPRTPAQALWELAFPTLSPNTPQEHLRKGVPSGGFGNRANHSQEGLGKELSVCGVFHMPGSRDSNQNQPPRPPLPQWLSPSKPAPAAASATVPQPPKHH